MSVKHPCMDHARNPMLLELIEPKPVKVKLSKKLLKTINAPVKRAEKERKQRIFESKRASPAEPKATVFEVKRSGQHEVKIIADDLNFIDWEHPFVQWATQQMFPMNTPEQLKEKRHSVGKNFVTFMLETMANFLTGEIKIFDRPVGERW